MYDRIGGNLSSTHSLLMINVERRMCLCRKDKPYGWIKSSYPPCVFKAFRGMLTISTMDIYVENFWECLVREVKRKHPEYVMEALMTEV